jgi:hypothetical protein
MIPENINQLAFILEPVKNLIIPEKGFSGLSFSLLFMMGKFNS